MRILNAYLNLDYFYILFTSSKFIGLGETIVEDNFTRQPVWWLCKLEKLKVEVESGHESQLNHCDGSVSTHLQFARRLKDRDPL